MKRLGLRIGLAVTGLLPLSCNQLLLPPAFSDAELAQSGLTLDSLGIWRDTTYGKPGLPFADIPISYRAYWRYCANCHSGSGQSSLAPGARKALLLNTWREISAYGPEKLILAAKAGGMPPAGYPRVPDDVLTRAQAYLASWEDTTRPVLLMGYQYKDAENFVRKYCADCHAPGGKDSLQPEAATALLLDSYEQWRRRQKTIAQRLSYDTVFFLSSLAMPPLDSRQYRMLDSSAGEKDRMLDWIARFSPNTPDGLGMGDSLYSASGVLTQGAMRGLLYPEAFRIINRYCADCHTEAGLNASQWDAWSSVPMDAYAQWKDKTNSTVKIGAFRQRLDSASAAGIGVALMPPPDFPYQPSKAERDTLLDWLNRGSPNTIDGR